MTLDDEWDDDTDFACAAIVNAATLMTSSGFYNYDKDPPRNQYLTVRQFTLDLVKSDEDCHNLLRMNIEAFDRLVYILKGTGRLHDTIHCNVVEQLAIFLHAIAHNEKNRSLKCYFKRSGATISYYFNEVMYAIISLHDKFIKPPEAKTPQEIKDNPRFWPYFKDCVEAVDGTHIPAKLPSDVIARFRGRKGKYYLVDAGYPLLRQFITPFRSTRYHLNEFRGRKPASPKELFNHRHSSLRNAIERAFGVLKKRFRILKEESDYPWTTQADVVIACCIIHNHLRIVMPNDALLEEVDRELREQEPDGVIGVETFDRNDEGRAGKIIRTFVMNHMWQDFNVPN